MASLEKNPSDEDASRTTVADLAINLADQLIDAFQQDTDTGNGAGETSHLAETASPENAAASDENTADAKDGDGEWQEMATDEDDAEDEGEDGTKEDGVGKERGASWVSPVGSHGFTTQDDGHRAGVSGDGNDVVFTPARVLNFDDSDGDDVSAVDQRFIPRGVFIQSDFMDDRPELHGSEEVDLFAANAGAMMNPVMGDQTQNVRIIEGHDDLDFDRGTAYMSLGLRSNFLQTQMVQLPPMSADDFHNHSANLYDSLEREDQDFFPEDDRREYHDDEMEDDRESTNGEEVDHTRDAYRPPFSDRNLTDESLDSFHSGGYVYAGQQYSGRVPPNFDAGEQGDGQAWNAEGSASPRRSPTRNLHGSVPEDIHPDKDQRLEHAEGDPSGHHPIAAGQNATSIGSGSSVVTLPTQTSSNTNLSHAAPANAADTKEHPEMQSARPKNMQSTQQVRGGPAGKGGAAGAVNAHGAQQVCPRMSRSDQRGAGAGSQNAVRNRVGVGSAGTGRQVASGAQRPAVQGAAVVAVSSGDGDGAVAGDNDSHMGVGAQSSASAGPVLPSRTSSQGSIHSTTSNNSNSRVSGVGKESNSNRNPQRVSKTQPAKPSDQFPAGASARDIQQPPPQRRQQQPPPASQRMQPSASQPAVRSGQQPPGKRTTGAAAARGAESRVSQLQQQRSQLQQEQQMLQQKQRQLQRQQQQQHQHSQQLQHLGGMDSPDGDNLVHHHPDAVVTQVGQLHQESQRQERDGRGNMSVEVQGMEEVRSRLQSMLRVPRDAAAFDSRAFDFADSASDLLMDRPPHHLRDDASSVSGYRGQEEMSDMFETFPSFSYKVYSDMSSMSMKSDMSSHSEVVYLRDCLEKERYRRKHCEQQIQALNGKLLETQQQLAVAVSTDKRKDIMIDQLDKQLAKVVEGWKKREADKDEYMHMVMKEKSQIEETLHKQQAMIDSFERDLANTVEELKQEKESSAAAVDKLKSELSAAIHDKEHSEDMLQAERERATLMEQEWEQLKESRDLAEKRAQQAQERLHSEQDNWYEREQELLHKIDQVKDANLKVMQMERVKLEEQTKKGEELEEKLHQAETEVKRLEMEVDSAVREKESLKVEMAITEAKFESAQRSLEADMHAQMEREISEQLNDVHEKMRAEQEEQAEKHRRMVSELHQRHQKDMEKQMSALRQETHRKEEDHRQQIAELESRLNEYRQENTTLKQAKQKLESQRMEVLTKLQFIMQSQWNEAVSLLASTPQRRNLSSSMASSLGLTMSGGLLGLAQQGGMSQSAGPQFNVSSSGMAATSGGDNLGSDKQQDGKGMVQESAGRNNLSGSPSASSTSSPRGHQNIPLHNSSPENGVGHQDTSSASRPPAPATGNIITLEDISAILSQGRQPPSSFTNSLHGVLHSGGLVVQTQMNNKHTQQSQQRPPRQHSQLHEDRNQSASAPGASVPHAIMIRPPQQLSHHAGPSDGAPSSHHFQEDFSFLSTSDISHDFSQLSRDLNGLHAVGGNDRESVRSVESRGWPVGFQTDRGLELRDLDLGPHGSLQNGWLGQNGSHRSDGGRSEEDGSSHLPPGAAYSPSSRNQSMSPPVKQGRDGEQEGDGSVLHESDRLNSSYRQISRQLEEHQARQRELQHYIKMLLDKPPQVLNDQPERDGTVECDSLEISLETVDPDLTDAAQAMQISTEFLRLQQLRDRQLAEATQSARPKVPQRRPDPGRSTEAARGAGPGAVTQPAGVLGPQQLTEISRLLGQYSEDVETANPLASLTSDPASMTQLLTFIASLPQQPGQAGTEERRSSSNKNSPRGNPPRRPRDPHKSKKSADVRHHSVGPDSSLSSSVMSDKHDRTMASSTKSTTSRKSDKKSASVASANTASSSAKQSVRPLSKDKQPQAWK